MGESDPMIFFYEGGGVTEPDGIQDRRTSQNPILLNFGAKWVNPIL
jgi:hypothetical protein